MAYYQRLKDLKEDADLTQAKVSEIIDVSSYHSWILSIYHFLTYHYHVFFYKFQTCAI